jgi:hypothetical protein
VTRGYPLDEPSRPAASRADWPDSKIVAQACHALGGVKGTLTAVDWPLFWLYAVKPAVGRPSWAGDSSAAATRSPGVVGTGTGRDVGMAPRLATGTVGWLAVRADLASALGDGAAPPTVRARIPAMTAPPPRGAHSA